MLTGGPYNPNLEAERLRMLEFQKAIAEAAEADGRQKRGREIINGLMTFQTSAFERAKSYSTLIITVGFAGYFTTLGACRSFLNPLAVALSSLLMIVTVFLFVTHELFNMKINSNRAVEVFKVCDEGPARVEEALAAYRKVEQRSMRRQLKINGVLFWITTVLGMSSALILTGALATPLFRTLWGVLK